MTHKLAAFAREWRSMLLCDASYPEFCHDLAAAAGWPLPKEPWLAACDAPVCAHHRKRGCVVGNMGVLWCERADKPATRD